jgi:hypothetical protein
VTSLLSICRGNRLSHLLRQGRPGKAWMLDISSSSSLLQSALICLALRIDPFLPLPTLHYLPAILQSFSRFSCHETSLAILPRSQVPLGMITPPFQPQALLEMALSSVSLALFLPLSPWRGIVRPFASSKARNISNIAVGGRMIVAQSHHWAAALSCETSVR